MIQELITYLIIGIAIGAALSQILAYFRKFRPKKTRAVSIIKPVGHDCSACSADCTLRDSKLIELKKNQELCSTRKRIIKSP